MKIFTLPKSPKVYDWRDEEECNNELDKYDLEYMEKAAPDAIFFWYVRGSYEGDGALIAVKDGRWYDKSLSHCSCFGPYEGFAQSIDDFKSDSLDDLLSKGSEDWKKEYGPLIELARANGYK